MDQVDTILAVCLTVGTLAYTVYVAKQYIHKNPFFSRKSSKQLVETTDNDVIVVKRGQNPFEVAFPQWFDKREWFFDPSSLPKYHFMDLSKILLKV